MNDKSKIQNTKKNISFKTVVLINIMMQRVKYYS